MHKLLLALGLSLCTSVAAHADIIYNAASDFSIASNPNGVWSYGYGTNSTFTAFTTSGAQWSGTNSYAYWSTSANGLPLVGHNTNNGTSGNTFAVPGTQLWLHPGSAASGQDAIVVFTVPTSGLYNLLGFFQRDDTASNGNGVNVSVLLNNVSLESSFLGATYLSTYNFSNSLSLKAGDKLEFLLNNNGDYSYDSTGLSATVTAVSPEPSSLMLLGTGVLGIAGMARRRFRRA